MLINLIKYVFTITGHQWRIGGTLQDPSEQDIRTTLDEAASHLYSDEYDVGATFHTGGLIIEKRPQGYAVYVHVGEFS